MKIIKHQSIWFSLICLISLITFSSCESPKEKIEDLEYQVQKLENRVEELESSIDEAVYLLSDAIDNLEYCDGYNFYYNFDLDDVTYNCEQAKYILEGVM